MRQSLNAFRRDSADH
uniref:Uncharacterized protein n=1 Tax=Anguilla anguilla TaxID=7936 RepID=A0A0E9UEP1_ANGAN